MPSVGESKIAQPSSSALVKVRMNSQLAAPARLVNWLRKRASRDINALKGDPNRYLKSCKGVIHVGANTGQEAKSYAALGLPVLWIEPIPEVFEVLLKNIQPYPKQQALNELIADVDGQTVTLHVANNQGASSSILDLHEHKDIWPDVEFVNDISCTAKTLTSALRNAGIDIGVYDALVLDTQGSELLVLKGAPELLAGFKYIRTEAADFEPYKDCATVVSIHQYLLGFGFKLTRQDKFAQRRAGGTYFDVLFERAG